MPSKRPTRQYKQCVGDRYNFFFKAHEEQKEKEEDMEKQNFHIISTYNIESTGQKFSTSLVGIELGRNSFYPNSIPTFELGRNSFYPNSIPTA